MWSWRPCLRRMTRSTATTIGAGTGYNAALLAHLAGARGRATTIDIDADTAAGTDANIIPLTMFDAVVTPDGSDVQLTTGVFFRAS